MKNSTIKILDVEVSHRMMLTLADIRAHGFARGLHQAASARALRRRGLVRRDAKGWDVLTAEGRRVIQIYERDYC